MMPQTHAASAASQSHTRSKRSLLLHWIPAMIGVAVILIESTGEMSATNTSRWLLPLWTKLFGPTTPEQWNEIHHWIRKTGHFVGYGFVSLGFFEGWRYTFASKVHSWWTLFLRAAALALPCTLLLASWDEWHQSFLPGRGSSVFDVGIDLSGAITLHIVLLVVAAVIWKLRSRRD